MIDTLLIDWSGTLADDLHATLVATNAVLAAFDVTSLDRAAFQREFELPFMRFYERFLPGVGQAEVDRIFFAAYEPLRDQIPLLPDARCFLEYARSSGMRSYVFSTMRPSLLESEVTRHGIGHLVDGLFGGIVDKAEAIGPIVTELRLRPDHTLFLGDMVHDIEAAQRGGVRAGAVATGYSPRERLVATAPDYLFDNLGEVIGFLARESAVEGLEMPIATVGGLVVHSDGELLLVRTDKWSGKWGTPGGKIEYGETVEQAFVREVQEEVGITIQRPEVLLVQDCVFSPEFYRKKHFLLINLRGTAAHKEVRLNYEASEFAWVTPAAALTMDLNQPTRFLIEQVYGKGGMGGEG
jgi:phosphoglycolate phosphatase